MYTYVYIYTNRISRINERRHRPSKAHYFWGYFFFCDFGLKCMLWGEFVLLSLLPGANVGRYVDDTNFVHVYVHNTNLYKCKWHESANLHVYVDDTRVRLCRYIDDSNFSHVYVHNTNLYMHMTRICESACICRRHEGAIRPRIRSLHSFRMRSAQRVVKSLRTCRPVQIITYQVNLRLYMGWLLLVGSFKIIGLFCRRALQKRLYSAKETCNFKEPTNRSHLISGHFQSTFLNPFTVLIG